jgi:hypothetical protein
MLDIQILSNKNMKLQPYWVTGFVDGEGTFYVGINPHQEMTAGYQVLPEFRIVQHQKDIQLLYALKNFFGCGVVRKNHDDRYELRIRKLETLSKVIVPFFEKHSLQTQKKYDFLSFRKIILLMGKDEHLTKEGIFKIMDIAKGMNRKDKTITQSHLDKDIVRSS